MVYYYWPTTSCQDHEDWLNNQSRLASPGKNHCHPRVESNEGPKEPVGRLYAVARDGSSSFDARQGAGAVQKENVDPAQIARFPLQSCIPEVEEFEPTVVDHQSRVRPDIHECELAKGCRSLDFG